MLPDVIIFVSLCELPLESLTLSPGVYSEGPQLMLLSFPLASLGRTWAVWSTPEKSPHALVGKGGMGWGEASPEQDKVSWMENSECCHCHSVLGAGTWAPFEDPGRRTEVSGSWGEVRLAHLGISFIP